MTMPLHLINDTGNYEGAVAAASAFGSIFPSTHAPPMPAWTTDTWWSAKQGADPRPVTWGALQNLQAG